MLTLSPGDRNGPVIEELLQKSFERRDCIVRMVDIYNGCLPLELFFSIFSNIMKVESWVNDLFARGYTHLHYHYNEVLPGRKFCMIREANSEPLKEMEFSGSWAARLRRYKAWFPSDDGSLRQSVLLDG